MKYIITESQVKSLYNMTQSILNSTINAIKEESEEWGMGEMDELDEVDSIDKIVVDNINKDKGLVVSLVIYKNSKRQDFDNLIDEIEARMSVLIPHIELRVSEIIDNRKFGPGIDF